MVLLSILFGVMSGLVASTGSFVPPALAQDEIDPVPRPGNDANYRCPYNPEGCSNLGCKDYGINQKICSYYNIVNGVRCDEIVNCIKF